jgi:alpha-1,6-mannosyltransferase
VSQTTKSQIPNPEATNPKSRSNESQIPNPEATNPKSQTMSYLLFFLAALAQTQCSRTNSVVLLLCFAVQFGAYFYILYQKNTENLRKNLLFAVFLHFCLVFTLPNLSDDVYRFLWDGTLWHEGLHPLAATPTQILAMSHRAFASNIFIQLYPQLNSPDYFTVYPSVCQAAFWVATACGRAFAHDADTNIYVSIIALKMLLAFAECGTLWLMLRLLQLLRLSPNKVLLYALNPLVLHEICGNAHCEGFMILGLVASFFVLLKNEKSAKTLIFAAFLFALSVHAKLLPLLFLPLLFVLISYKNSIRAKFSESIKFIFFTDFFIILLSLPLLNADFVGHFGESLNLYFQKFEYNASVYYLLRAAGFWLKGYNWIAVVGPVTAILGLVLMAGVAFRFFIQQKNAVYINTEPSSLQNSEVQNNVARSNEARINESTKHFFFKSVLFTISIYLSCTTILHPWYLVLPIFLSVFTNFKYPIVWSALIFLTYINYAHTPFYESTWVLCIEYGILWLFSGFEYYKNKNK